MIFKFEIIYMKSHLLLLTFICLLLACNSSKKEEKNQVVIGATMLSMQTEFIVNISDEMQKKRMKWA